jgi:hemerythrin-like domain-containing protein
MFRRFGLCPCSGFHTVKEETFMATRSTATDAIALLKEDHKRVREMLAKLDKSSQKAGDSREKLLEKIQQELQIHTTIEEEIFYPAYRAAVSKQEDAKLYKEALEEHHIVDVVLAEIGQSDAESEEFSAKAKVLKDLVEHHAEEEEKQMFPRARRVIQADKRKELGEQMAARKRELESSDRGWLPAAGKLIAAVTGRSSSSGRGGRAQSSAAARGSGSGSKKASGTARAAGKSATSRGKASAKTSGSKSARAKSGGSRSRKQAR